MKELKRFKRNIARFVRELIICLITVLLKLLRVKDEKIFKFLFQFLVYTESHM